MGCSYIFGTTVEDNQTIPFYVAERNKTIMPYNFGKPEGALQHIWYHLQNTNIKKDVRPRIKGHISLSLSGFSFKTNYWRTAQSKHNQEFIVCQTGRR